MSERQTSGVKRARPSGHRASRSAALSGVKSVALSASKCCTLKTTAVELTKTSRAAKEVMSPMPILQSKPSGLMTGSIRWPARPAKLYWSWAGGSDPAGAFG